MVRRLGPGVPLRAAVARRRRLRQGAGRAAAAHALPAPERADPRLRVELRRRQPAGHGLGGAVGLRARGRDPRRGRPRVPRARLPAPADELHLVGQPQGPRRPQPLPGRLPRARQHRHLRPLGAAARRRHARAGRRHGVDGAVLPVDAADRGRARARRPGVPRHRAEVRLALRVDRDRAEPARRRHAAVGRAGRLLLRRHAHAGRRDDPAEGALARRPAAAVRGHRLRRRPRRAPPRAARARAGVRRALRRRGAVARPPARAEPRGPAAARARRRDPAAPDPRGHARRGRVPRAVRDPRDLAPPPRPAVPLRVGRPDLRGPLPAGGVRHRHVRRQLELARAGVVPDEPRDPARRCSSCTATTATA